MDVLKNHLWKEWREQRALVLALLLLLPILSTTAVLAFESMAIVSSFVPLCTAFAVLLVAIALSSRSIGHELTDDGLFLLGRLPPSLWLPFGTKLLSFAAALVLLGAWSAGSTLLARWALLLHLRGPIVARDEQWSTAIQALHASLLVFAVTCWVPRS